MTIDGLHKTESTYALVEVDRVFAGDDISDGAALGLAGRLLAGGLCGRGHFLREVVLANGHVRYPFIYPNVARQLRRLRISQMR